MGKKVENSRLYNLLHKSLVVWACMYLMLVLGMICNIYFNLKGIWVSIIILNLLMVCYGIIVVVRAESINEDEFDYYTLFYFFCLYLFYISIIV